MPMQVVVVGAGIMGCATAYHLARSGHQVTLLEQFAVGHSRGSSHGHSRIIRYVYDHPVYVELMRHAYQLWHELEGATGQQLLWRTGGLDIGPAESLAQTREALLVSGVAFDELDGPELQRRFPQFQLPPETVGIYQVESGILNADDCVQLLAAEIQRLGGVLRQHERVIALEPQADGATVVTDAGRYQADRVVLTLGSWAQSLLSTLGVELDLRILQEQVAFFEPVDAAAFTAPAFPIFIDHGRRTYGFPIFGLPGVKVAFHVAGPQIDPLQGPLPAPPEQLERLQAYVRDMFPQLTSRVLYTTTCRYTMTSDEHFVLDLVPGHPSVVIGSPCSGHGFKFGMLMGRILAELALTGATAYPIEMFRAQRLLRS